MKKLRDMNPVSEAHGDAWAASPEGGRARDRMLSRTEVAVTAEAPATKPDGLMRVLVPAAAMVLVAATLAIFGGRATPVAAGGCPVTVPEMPYFVPPDRFPATPPDLYASAWYGTDDLFTMIEFEGADFEPTGDKLIYWSEHFSSRSDDYFEPGLTVTATHLDGAADPLSVTASRANNGSRGDIGTFMITGMVLPEAGCWKITAEYQDAELSYIVEIPEQ